MGFPLRILYSSGLASGSIQATIRRNSDNYMYRATTTLFEANNDSHVANYGITLTDLGGDKYENTATTMAAGSYTVVYYLVLTPFALLTTSAILGGEIFEWDGTAVTGSPSVGANQTTVANLVTILETTARKAGRGSASGPYDLTEKHLAIQACLESLIRRTKCTVTTAEISIDTPDEAMDFSSITGFRTSRIFRIWAYPDDTTVKMSNSPDIQVVDLEEIFAYRNCNGIQSGFPLMIGFGNQTGTDNLLARSADIEYVVKVRYWQTLSSWTAGDTGAGSTVINMSGDLAKQAVRLYGVEWLQSGDLEQLPITDRRRTAWDDFIKQNMGAEHLGSLSVRRKSLDQIRSERWGRSW